MAELDGTAPAEVRAAARNLIVSALDESRALAVLPDEQIRLGLTLAGRDSTTRVDVATARELAVRGAVRTVVTGTIDQVGQTYHAAVRVLEADSNKVVETGRGIARGEDDLIPTLDRVMRALRVKLGEQRSAIAANRELFQAVTPSFAAYQRFQRGKQLVRDNDNLGARAAYKEALALDSGFAAAWLGLSAVYTNLGFGDSSRLASAQGSAHPERLTEQQRLTLVETRRVCGVGNVWACLATREQLHRRYGGDPIILAVAEHSLGRDSEAVALTEEWQRSAPFGLRPIERNNLTQYLMGLGRIDEARRMAESIPGEFGLLQRMWLAAWTADWSAADSLARSFVAQSQNPRQRANALRVQASVAAVRGRVQEALRILRNCNCLFTQMVLRLVSGPTVGGPQSGTLPPDTSAGGQLFAAMWAISAGDTAAASRMLTRVQGLPPEQRRGLDPDAAFVEALLATPAGRPAEAAALLRTLADGRASGSPALAQPAQWSLAEAYERLGQLDSAAVQLERLANWQGPRGDFGNVRGLTDSFARQRLVLLYSRMGRFNDARRHWRVFSETFTTPDPELQHLVDEARAALANVEGRP